jgi:hypothetical protein
MQGSTKTEIAVSEPSSIAHADVLHSSPVSLTRFSDRQLLFGISAVLFVLSAWPIALTEVPPYQDLPNHLATVVVMENPAQYPQLAFNGFFKTNAALFAWLYFVGKLTGLKLGARLFALIVLGANAYVFPRFVLALTGSRKRMVVASLFMWPMIHNWFVSTGMLDFALAIPLSLAMLVALERQRRSPSHANSLVITGLGTLTWYAHVFPLLVVHMLVLIEVLVRAVKKERSAWAEVRALALPLLPVTGLVLVSIYGQLHEAGGPNSAGVDYGVSLPAWDLVYNVWAEWMYGFSKLSLTSLVPCLVLAWLAVSRRNESPPFFSPLALAAVALLYTFSPYIITNWFHVNSRLIPYVWMGLLLRVPETLPRRVATALGACAVLYSAGLGVDFIRLERERREFIAGASSIPEGARLLPLLFRHKDTSDNTRNLLHYWGYYVTEKHTAAPLLFAHSRSFPVTYRSPPPQRLNHLVLERFAWSNRTPQDVCAKLRTADIVSNDCEASFRTVWRDFWLDAAPLYDHILLWDATPEARASIPPEYTPIFEQARLTIYARH